jgi:tetratricopeptide (TPR) repeat protein
VNQTNAEHGANRRFYCPPGCRASLLFLCLLLLAACAGGPAPAPSYDEWDEVIVDSNQAIRLNPNNAVAYYNRGLAWYHKGNLDWAIADYNEAIRLNPGYAEAYFNRGNAWDDKGDYRRARTDWEKALQLDPNLSQARENLELLRGMGQ